MLLRITLVLIMPLIALVAVHNYVIPLSDPEVIKFYSEKLRSSLFTGFLTLGSFLFSLKTFIIIKMKENVYEHQKYRSRIEEGRKINPSLTYYGPLKRLGDYLFCTVLAAAITSASQFTIGLLPCWQAVAICLYFAAATIILFISSLFIIRANLSNWFSFLEDEANK